MEDYLIDFKNMDWESPSVGVRSKAYIRNHHKIRLAEFTEEFVEEDWCTKGHTGYIVEGSLSIDFNGMLTNLRADDGLFIPEGEEHKHKAKVAKGEKALVILFEKC
jgi:hypothetical protein